MTSTTKLLSKVQKLVESVDKGNLDPLDVALSEAYQDLRELSAEVDSRIDIDEMLNDILGSKITRVQELARILAAPELYVNRLKELKPRKLGKLIVYKQPIKMTRLTHSTLTKSLDRVIQHLDALSREPDEEQIPEMSGLPNDFKFKSEDSVFLADLAQYLKTIPRKKRIPIAELLNTKDFDIFLKRFLYIVVLISRGEVEYFEEEKQILRS